MNITYQYYNEIVLGFGDYEVDYREGVIIIEVPESNKSFEVICSKVNEHLIRISQTLEPRDQSITVRVVSGEDTFEINLDKEA
ncbi:hypothetical protein [Desertivirga brevis]|uniref:hypothetical protein n=1 Tax=Desertivirga brevis TaxID=2810310 RepID=UPI001A95DFD2|nr:hypothetical protein [Pedobacter sp. SYSU D00873]